MKLNGHKGDAVRITALIAFLRSQGIGWRHFALPLVASILVAALTGAMLALLAPVVTGLVTQDFSFAYDIFFLGPVLKAVVQQTGLADSGIVGIASLLVVIIAIAGLLAYALNYWLNAYTAIWRGRLSEKLSVAVFNQILAAEQKVHEEVGQGRLVELMNSGRSVANVLDIGQSSLLSALQLVVRLAVMLSLSIPGTIVVLAFLPVLALGAYWIRKRVQASVSTVWDLRLEQGREINNALSSIDLVKAQNAAPEMAARFAARAEAIRRQEITARKLTGAVGPLQDAIALLALSILLLGAIEYIGLQDKERLASFGVLFFLARTTVPFFAKLNSNRVQLDSLGPHISSVTEVLGTKAEPDGAETFIGIFDGLDFEDICYAHESGRSVDNIQISINRGETVALAGESGSGKTTLLKLILQLYKPQRGCLRIDGEDCRKYRVSSLREKIAYVGQESLLSHDSIRANLLFGLSNVVSDIELHAALSRVGLSEVCHDLDVIVGDRGCKLSGGERQRLSLARALLRMPQILLLDEPTSALDAESTEQVFRAIAELPKDTTVVIAAHSERALSFADRVIQLEDGHIVETNEALSREGAA